MWLRRQDPGPPIPSRFSCWERAIFGNWPLGLLGLGWELFSSAFLFSIAVLVRNWRSCWSFSYPPLSRNGDSSGANSAWDRRKYLGIRSFAHRDESTGLRGTVASAHGGVGETQGWSLGESFTNPDTTFWPGQFSSGGPMDGGGPCTSLPKLQGRSSSARISRDRGCAGCHGAQCPETGPPRFGNHFFWHKKEITRTRAGCPTTGRVVALGAFVTPVYLLTLQFACSPPGVAHLGDCSFTNENT